MPLCFNPLARLAQALLLVIENAVRIDRALRTEVRPDIADPRRGDVEADEVHPIHTVAGNSRTLSFLRFHSVEVFEVLKCLVFDGCCFQRVLYHISGGASKPLATS